uniref:Uncharacterized protein n=1 Tax=Lygus hesperus TaxID=30085 RepID=A0A146LM29_LYGHE
MRCLEIQLSNDTMKAPSINPEVNESIQHLLLGPPSNIMWQGTLYLACAVAVVVCSSQDQDDYSNCKNVTECRDSLLADMLAVLDKFNNCFPDASACCCVNNSTTDPTTEQPKPEESYSA